MLEQMLDSTPNTEKDRRMCALFLGIDNGGTNIKASLYDAGGNELASAGTTSDTRIEIPGFIEQDMEALWQKNCQVIKAVIASANIPASSIKGIAVTGHGNGLYAIDGEGNPIGNGILSADSRSNAIVDGYYASGVAGSISAISCQDVWAGQPPAILTWLKRHDRRRYDAIAWILMCKDYIRYRLTGEVWAERTDYSGTNFIDPHTGDYDDRLLDLFDLSDCKDKLPPIKASTDLCGRVSRHASRASGLKEGTAVFGGMFDIDANAIGMGIVAEHLDCIIAGTWSINQCITEKAPGAGSPYRCTNYCMPGHWLITESSPTSASNLDWFIRQLLKGAPADGSPYPYCDQLVATVDPQESDVLFLPFLYGSNVTRSASAAFLGLSGWHSSAHVIAALYEGVVFSHRMHLDRLRRDYPRVDHTRLSGGAARSSVWVQLFADILARPIELLEHEEVGTLGAAMAAAVGSGQFSNFEQASAKMVRVRRTIQPQMGLTGVFEKKYAHYCRAVETLQAIWEPQATGGPAG